VDLAVEGQDKELALGITQGPMSSLGSVRAIVARGRARVSGNEFELLRSVGRLLEFPDSAFRIPPLRSVGRLLEFPDSAFRIPHSALFPIPHSAFQDFLAQSSVVW
jgi:hypothetical protein